MIARSFPAFLVGAVACALLTSAPRAQAKPATGGQAQGKPTKGEEVKKADPIKQLKNSLEQAKKESAYLRKIKERGGILGRFKRSRATTKSIIKTFTPPKMGPVAPMKKFVARLLGDNEKATLPKNVVFTVQKIPVTKPELDAAVEFCRSFPRADATEDVQTAAIKMLVRSRAWQGIYPTGSRKAYEAALEIQSELKNGKSFADLARQHSDDKATGQNGGRRADIVKKTADMNYARATFGLKVGQVSGVVPTANGYHIIRLLGKKAGATPDLDSAKTAHIYKAFSMKPSDQTKYAELLRAGRIDVAFRTDELRKFMPSSFQ